MKKIFLFLSMLPLLTFAEDIIIPGQALIRVTLPYRGKLLTGTYSGVEEMDNYLKKINAIKIEKLIDDPRLAYEEEDFGLDRLYLIHFPDTISVLKVVEELKKLSMVEEAWPSIGVEVYKTVPNDPRFSSQWHLFKCKLPEAWDITQGDTSIVVCCVDNGVEWKHEDIEANLWINKKEDINRDGRFTDADLNGVDDDRNGKVDDVIGWNFKRNSPDPSPDIIDPFYASHGTQVLGIAIAVTNNNKGVASPGWKCRGMAVNCDLDNRRINLTLAIQAIYYAAANGANIISMSWGGYYFDSAVNSAIQYAHNKGCILVAAAGNDNNEVIRYPAGYENVIAVAASNQGDKRSYYSSYGTWVDLCAPGDYILTTTLKNKYDAPSGTSMSAPVVAGIMALLWSVKKDWKNYQITERILETCDSMPDPLYNRGKLGKGRINALNAIGPLTRCFLQTTDYSINDADADGYIEEGENVNLVITLRNEKNWMDAQSVEVNLSEIDRGFHFIKNSASFGRIANGATKSNSNSPFVLKGADFIAPHKARVYVHKKSVPLSYDILDTIWIPIGKPRILLVDDDGGADYEKWYKISLDSFGFVLYDYWEVKSQGTPPTLRNYPVVIWFTGDDSVTTLTDQDITVLKNYLDNGGKLFISGKNIGQDIHSKSFYKDYLHAQLVTPNIDEIFLIGVPGDPISQGDTCVAAGGGGANNRGSYDGIAPLGDAKVVFKYKESNHTAGIRYEGNYKVVYFAFPFEALDGSRELYTQKEEILRRILEDVFGEVNPLGIKEKEEYQISSLSLQIKSVSPNGVMIKYNIPSSQRVRITVYDILGRNIKNLFNGFSQKGTHHIYWNFTDDYGRDINSGIYFLTLKTGKGQISQKLVVVK